MKTSRAILSLVFVLWIGTSLVLGDVADSERQGRIRVSGIVAKLIPKHRVIIHSSKQGLMRSYTARLNEFPLDVRRSDFGAAFVDFENKRGKRVLSVLFSRPLFREGNDVTLKLNKPTMEVRVSGSGKEISIHQWAWIAKDIGYATMPCWDRVADRVVAAENPTIEIREKGISKPIFTAVMKNGCLGYGWLACASLPKDIAKGTELSITIIHKTGDLFGEISTTTAYVVK